MEQFSTVSRVKDINGVNVSKNDFFHFTLATNCPKLWLNAKYGEKTNVEYLLPSVTFLKVNLGNAGAQPGGWGELPCPRQKSCKSCPILYFMPNFYILCPLLPHSWHVPHQFLITIANICTKMPIKFACKLVSIF